MDILKEKKIFLFLFFLTIVIYTNIPPFYIFFPKITLLRKLSFVLPWGGDTPLWMKLKSTNKQIFKQMVCKVHQTDVMRYNNQTECHRIIKKAKHIFNNFTPWVYPHLMVAHPEHNFQKKGYFWKKK